MNEVSKMRESKRKFMTGILVIATAFLWIAFLPKAFADDPPKTNPNFSGGILDDGSIPSGGGGPACGKVLGFMAPCHGKGPNLVCFQNADACRAAGGYVDPKNKRLCRKWCDSCGPNCPPHQGNTNGTGPSSNQQINTL